MPHTVKQNFLPVENKLLSGLRLVLNLSIVVRVNLGQAHLNFEH